MFQKIQKLLVCICVILMIVLDVFIDSILHKHGYMAVSQDSDHAVILPLYIILIIILANTAVIDVLFKKNILKFAKKY